MKYTITHAEMVAKLIKSGEQLRDEFTTSDCRLIHSTFGIVGELGELLGGIEIAYAKRTLVDKANILEELGDLEFYLQDFRTVTGFSREEILTCEDICEVASGPVRMAAHMLVYGTDLMDEVKKSIIYRKSLNKKAVIANLSKIEYILEFFRKEFGFTWEQTLEANMDKLAVRYPDFGYTDQRAQQRVDKQPEISILKREEDESN